MSPSPAFLKSVADTGLYLESELQRISARHGLGEVRGRGLLLALDLKIPIAASIVAQAFDDGVLLNAPRPDALRFMPALNVTREEIALMIDCLDAILAKIGAAQAGGVGSKLRHSGMRCAVIASHGNLDSDAQLHIWFDASHRSGMTTGRYGFKIDAPVVARLSRSIWALAASFSA